jgi:hypothetical protein
MTHPPWSAAESAIEQDSDARGVIGNEKIKEK